MRAKRPRSALTVRTRTTLVVVAVVGAAVGAGSWALLAALHTGLQHDVQAQANLRARDLAASLSRGIPLARLLPPGQENSVVQVLDRSGRVVASSPRLRGEAPLADPPPGSAVVVSGRRFMQGERFLVVSRRAQGPGRPITILVADTLESADRGVAIAARSLLIGGPLLVALVAGLSLAGVGWALRPVEEIRAEVTRITSARLHRRVPAPPSRDEIGRLAETMNQMLDRLEAAQRRQRAFVSDASHELRSPIATIRQLAEVKLAHPDGASATKLARDVLLEEQRLQALVDDLLLLARMDEHGLPAARSPIDIDDLLLGEAKRLRNEGLVVDTSGIRAARTEGAAAHLERVVRNLSDNAARHARGRVAMSCRLEDGHVVADVDDDGPGIPPEHRSVIFERFTRLDHARARDHGGAGLGLAIASEIVTSHEGTMEVGTSPLGGARFRLRLPAAD